jgi:hypothetical protein
MEKTKIIAFLAIAIPLIVLAKELSFDANGSPFDASNLVGASLIIRTSVNQNVGRWDAGDRIMLTQGNMKYTYVYRANGNFTSGGATRLFPKRRHKKLN